MNKVSDSRGRYREGGKGKSIRVGEGNDRKIERRGKRGRGKEERKAI